MAPNINCDKSGVESQGFLSSLYLSLSEPTTGTLDLCFQRSANRTQGHLSLGSGQSKKCFWAPALSEQPKFDPWGIGWDNDPGALPLASTLIPLPLLSSMCWAQGSFRRIFSLTWCECWRCWWLLSKCRMQHQWDTPLETSVLWTWLVQEVLCRGSSFPPLLQGEKGRNLGEAGLRANGNDSCIFPATGETTA